MNQVEEHLICKHEALSSNPNPTKIKRYTDIDIREGGDLMYSLF
jgi:hypothetical protein